MLLGIFLALPLAKMLLAALTLASTFKLPLPAQIQKPTPAPSPLTALLNKAALTQFLPPRSHRPTPSASITD